MCGIVSVVGEITLKEENIFKDMLQMDVIRGKDSTGVISVNKASKVSTVKAVGAPQELMDMRKFDSLMRDSHVALIGHNRAATMGSVTKNNAHPFQLEHITGVHNGTLRNKFNLIDSADFEVDSENLYHAISQKGLRDTIKDVNGAYTLAYVDEKAKTINFLRNTERPLWFATSTKSNTQLFASEKWMIEAACARRDYPIGNVVELKPHTLVSLTYDAKGIAKIDIEKDIPHYVAPVYKPPVYNTPVYVMGNHKKPSGNKVSQSFYGERKEALKKLMGKSLEGTLTSIIEPNKHNNFNGYGIYRIATGHGNINLFARLYLGMDAKEIGMLRPKLNNHFTFKIKNVGSIENVDAWGVIDKRTLKQGFLEDDGFILGFRGKQLTPEEYKDATSNGCSWCSIKVDEQDSEDIEWLSSKEFVCNHCYHDNEVWTYLN